MLRSSAYLVRRVARHPAGLKVIPVKGRMNLHVGSVAILGIGTVDMYAASLEGGLPRLNSMAGAKGSSDRINGY